MDSSPFFTELMARISSLERMVKLLVYYLSTQENDGKNRSREVRNKNYEEDSLDGDMDTNLTFEQLKQLISTLRQDNLCSVEDKNKAVDSLLETKRSPAGDTSATSHQHNPKDSNAPSSSLRPTDRLRPPSQSNSAQSSPVSHRRKVSTEWSQSTNVSTTESDKKRSHVFTSQSESHRSKQRGVPHEENIVVVPSVPNTLSPTSNHNSSTFPSNVNSNLFSKIVLLTNTQLNALIHSEFNEVLQLENGVHSLGRSNGSRFKLGTDKRDKHSDITPLLTAAEIQNKIIGIMKENSTLYEKYCYWIDRLVQQQKTLRRGSISSVSLPTTSSTRALPYDGIVTLNVIVHDSRGNAIHTTKCACVPLNSTVRSFQNKISKQIPAIDSEKWGLVLTSTGILLQAHRTFNSYLLRKEEEVIFQKVSKKLCRVVVIENNGAASTPEVSEVDVIPTKTTLFGLLQALKSSNSQKDTTKYGFYYRKKREWYLIHGDDTTPIASYGLKDKVKEVVEFKELPSHLIEALQRERILQVNILKEQNHSLENFVIFCKGTDTLRYCKEECLKSDSTHSRVSENCASDFALFAVSQERPLPEDDFVKDHLELLRSSLILKPVEESVRKTSKCRSEMKTLGNSGKTKSQNHLSQITQSYKCAQNKQ
jgi:hypothetical protein